MNITQMTWRPRGMYCLCRRIEPNKTTQGGIHLPDSQTGWQGMVEVLEVGPGRYDEEKCRQVPISGIKRGDCALVRGLSLGNLTTMPQDRELVLVHEQDILAVTEGMVT